MKKRLLTGLILFSLTLTSCATQTDNPTTTTSRDTTTVEALETTTAPQTTLAEVSMMDNFQALLTETSTAADLGLFIKEHITEASPEEAELMLQWLLIYQSEPILKINDLIYTEEYANPLYDVMGGIIDPDKVADIEDVTVRNDFQALIDGYMTLVRYEETPVIETDWPAIASLKDAFSEDMSAFLTLKAESRNYYSEDYYKMAEQIVMVEDRINATDHTFLKSQLQKLHADYIYDLLLGPEGMHMGTFVGKSDVLYEDLMRFAEDDAQSSFGQFLLLLDGEDWENFVGPQDAIQTYVAFGYGSKYHWLSEKVVTDMVEGERVTLVSDVRPDIATKVNEGIDQAIASLAQETDGLYGYNVYASYSTDDYISVYVSLHYLATPDQVKYLESALSFDLNTGDIMTLSDYLGMSEEATITFINQATGADYTMLPNFQLTPSSLVLSPSIKDTTSNRWTMIPTKALVPYVSFEALQR